MVAPAVIAGLFAALAAAGAFASSRMAAGDTKKAQRKQQGVLGDISNDYEAYRPEVLSARVNALNQALGMFQAPNNMLTRMYGEGVAPQIPTASNPFPFGSSANKDPRYEEAANAYGGLGHFFGQKMSDSVKQPVSAWIDSLGLPEPAPGAREAYIAANNPLPSLPTSSGPFGGDGSGPAGPGVAGAAFDATRAFPPPSDPRQKKFSFT